MLTSVGLLDAKYYFSSFVTVTFQRGIINTEEKTREKTREKIISAIHKNIKLNTEELAEILNISIKGVEWQLKNLKESGIIKRIGAG